MPRLVTLFAFTACSLLLVQCKNTYISVPFRVECQTPFLFSISLVEDDSFPTRDDVLAFFTGEPKQTGLKLHQFDGIIAGFDTNDSGGNFELQLRITHNCSSSSWITNTEDLDYIMKCKVGNDRCDYPKQRYRL